MISPTLPLPPVSDLPSSVGALFGVRRPQFGTISSWKRLEFGSQDFSFQMFHTVDLDSVALLSSFLQSTKMELSSMLSEILPLHVIDVVVTQLYCTPGMPSFQRCLSAF